MPSRIFLGNHAASAPGTVVPNTAALTLATFIPTIVVGVSYIPATKALVITAFIPTVLIEEFVAYQGIERQIDPADWLGTTIFYLEVHGFTANASFLYKARLWNKTNNQLISGSEVFTAATVVTRMRSSSFSLPAGSKLYEVQFGGATGILFTTEDAVLIGEPA